MVVTSSRCFPFRVLITQAQIWTIFELKTRQVYFIYPWFPHWLKLGKALQTSCVKQSIFHLSWHFKEEKSVFWKAFFCKTRILCSQAFTYMTSRLVTIFLVSVPWLVNSFAFFLGKVNLQRQNINYTGLPIEQELRFQKIDIRGVNFHTWGVICDLYRRLKNSIIPYFWPSLDIYYILRLLIYL